MIKPLLKKTVYINLHRFPCQYRTMDKQNTSVQQNVMEDYEDISVQGEQAKYGGLYQF